MHCSNATLITHGAFCLQVVARATTSLAAWSCRRRWRRCLMHQSRRRTSCSGSASTPAKTEPHAATNAASSASKMAKPSCRKEHLHCRLQKVQAAAAAAAATAAAVELLLLLLLPLAERHLPRLRLQPVPVLPQRKRSRRCPSRRQRNRRRFNSTSCR